jgi:galactose mutarotase-like enzyme
MAEPSVSSVSIRSAGLTASLSEKGAELVRLQDREGRDLLWDGNPAVWAGHAPLLFPIVGNANHDRIRVDGVDYPIARHGVARTARFELVASDSSSCRWRLRADDETRRHYPFDFVLDVTYAIDADRLAITAVVRNAGDRPMPASFGFHPAFRWPLPYGQARGAHEIRFEAAEPAAVRRLDNGLLSDVEYASPVAGNRLMLRDELFVDDALVFDRLTSRRVVYGAPNGPAIEIAFPGMPQLGVWTKPGAGFICIEPWHGFASPVGFDGELVDKPGMVVVPVGGSETFAITITLLPAPGRLS